MEKTGLRMAVYTPDLVERICASGRRLSREHFLRRLRRAGGEEFGTEIFVECCRRYFPEERWELISALLYYAEEHCGPAEELDLLRIKMLWCQGNREAALSLAREKAASASVMTTAGQPRAGQLLEEMEAARSVESLIADWRQEAEGLEDPSDREMIVYLSLRGAGLDPWKTAAATGMEDWTGELRGGNSPRRFHLRSTAQWRAESPAESGHAAERVLALLEHAGWPFPPPWRWPLRWTEPEGVDLAELVVTVTGPFLHGNMIRVDGWFDSGLLAALGDLDVTLEVSRDPD